MSPVNCMKIRRVIKPDGETEYFYIKTVELQVDTCPRYFFAIVLDSIMHRAYHEGEKDLGSQLLSEKSRRNVTVNITDIDFTDNLTIVLREVKRY